MTDLKAFQRAAVDRICERLNASDGSRRFLLADEVGLGKTMVARGVLQRLEEQKDGRKGMVCVYLCSNLEIAEQNRDKLANETKEPATRLTLIPLRAKAVHEERKKNKPQLFLFTPGTSLKLSGTTGIKSERQLLLSALYGWRPQKLGASLDDWIEFFRCNAGRDKWVKECPASKLSQGAADLRESRLERQLIARWQETKVRLRFVGEEKEVEHYLPDALYRCVKELAASLGKPSEEKRARRNRNILIGALRQGAAEAALDFLAPDLILVDEFQRFKDIIELADDDKTLAHRLFTGSGEAPRVLILSATPYKAVTFNNDTDDHYSDFQRTLSFLLGNKTRKKEWIADVNRRLLLFREMLTASDTDLPALMKLKGELEQRLKEVICRTERNRYVLDERKGVEDRPDLQRDEPLPVPHAKALAEFMRLRSFLQKHDKEGRPLPSIMDFWKSCSSIVTFMDSSYVLIQHLKKEKVRVDSQLLLAESELAGLAGKNLKLETLVARIKESTQSGLKDRERWRFLWTRPTYFYYRDEFFGGTDPTKFLVFSRWRFVPKAISFVVSSEFEPALRRKKRGTVQTQKLSSETLKFCMPLVSLAGLVDIAGWAVAHQAKDPDGEPPISKLRKHVRKRLKEELKKAGIPIVKRARKKLFWPALLGLERWHLRQTISTNAEHVSKGGPDILRMLKDALESDPQRHSDPVQVTSFLNLIESWLDIPHKELVFPKELLEDAVALVLGSPAVSLLRTIRSTYPTTDVDKFLTPAVRAGFQGLRTFFNKGYVQEIIGGHARSGRYADQILRYCFDAHFQSVLDEYSYLVRHVLQRADVDKFVSHVVRVLAIGAGTPNINVPAGPSGRIKEKRSQRPVNFAMAFGEENQPDEVLKNRTARKTAVREAFNSPFWPFVLATTSIGQEGLDFHLYCCDVMHWNLPSNPVDLEQREGRINRFDGLVVRRNIKKDYPLWKLVKDDQLRSNLWDRIFRYVEEDPTGVQHSRHGLFPHWIYEPVCDEPMRIRRHLVIFDGSRDRLHYERLKKYLYYYRLAFGQARQQDLLDRIVDRPDEERLRKELQDCMLNLSPFSFA